MLDDAQVKLREAFQSLAGEALKSSSDQFIELAKSKFDSLQKEAAGRSRAAQDRHPVHGGSAGNGLERSSLGSVPRGVRAGKRPTAAFAAKCNSLPLTSKELREETGGLVNSLKQPQVKGKWGELTLRRAVELAGMSPHCDFEEQQSVDTEEGRLRPDLIVHLPGGTQIVVDAKVPLHAAFESGERAVSTSNIAKP